MFKISVMYPNNEGARFDHDYYINSHIKLVEEHMTPFGLVKTEVDRGLPDEDGNRPLYICIGHMYFDKMDGYVKGSAEKGPVLRDDISNFTNVVPVRQLSEIINK
ncbi:MAG: EthD family reductase [Deltaproteobacteria bacterium]|nr:EthD family reductase [Deltaproteobacteria bacterium]